MSEIVLALDLPSADEAIGLVDRIDGLRWVKVGSVLFVREGPALIEALKRRDLRVFLDLKWHDIPNTVAGAVRHANDLGADMGSLHALGGSEMMSAAVAERGRMSLVAVTILTSHDGAGIEQTLGKPTDVADEVRRLAGLSISAGVDGVVCSARELRLVADVVGSGPLVVPGIRMVGQESDDQSRIATPESAAAGGATHLVVGRAVLRAEDPPSVFASLAGAVS
jgi:orotidine-5'-phosphate decarboxylase